MATNEQKKRGDFELFKSNVCHLVKDKGDIDFLIDALTSNEVRKMYEQKWYAESFYLLAMIDYLSRENDIPLCSDYDDIRCQKMKNTLFPAGVVLMDAIMKTDKYKEESLRRAIPEFMNFNIVEAEVRNVY